MPAMDSKASLRAASGSPRPPMTITITQPSLFLVLSFDAAIGQEIGRFWLGDVIFPPFFSRRLDLPEFDPRNDAAFAIS